MFDQAAYLCYDNNITKKLGRVMPGHGKSAKTPGRQTIEGSFFYSLIVSYKITCDNGGYSYHSYFNITVFRILEVKLSSLKVVQHHSEVG